MFTDSYEISVYETLDDDANPELNDNTPTPVTGVLVTARCVNSTDRSQVNNPSDLRYSILQGDIELFSINDITGEFSVANVPFDYENLPSYSVEIYCYLASHPNINGTGTVKINIESLNEYLPTFDDPILARIPENAPIGTVVISTDPSKEPLEIYVASDRDDGPDGVIIYLLDISPDNNDYQSFTLDRITGTLILNQELDVDDTSAGFKNLQISIIACNEDIIDIDVCPTGHFTIFVTAVNDLAPKFNESSYSESISESEMNGTVILQVLCLDGDRGGEGKVKSIRFQDGTSNETLSTFDLVVDLNTPTLDTYTADVILLNELDYENTSSYMFTLVCSDNIHTDTTQVTININPVNDIMPYFEKQLFEFTVERADPTPTETIIGTVTAIDNDDGGIGNELTYSITNSSSSKFRINSETGELSLKDYLSISDGKTFEFDVVASDGIHETRTSVKVTAVGLLSVLEWLYVACGCAVLLVIIIIIGIIVFYHFIKAARPKTKIIEKYKE